MPVDLEELVRQLKAENNSFRGNFEELKRTHAALGERYDSLELQLKTVEAEKSSIQSQHDTMVDEWRTQLQHKSEEFDTLRKQLQQQAPLNPDLFRRQVLEEYQTEMDKRHEMLITEIERSRHQVLELQREIEDHKAVMKEKDRDYQGTLEDLAAHHQQELFRMQLKLNEKSTAVDETVALTERLRLAQREQGESALRVRALLTELEDVRVRKEEDRVQAELVRRTLQRTVTDQEAQAKVLMSEKEGLKTRLSQMEDEHVAINRRQDELLNENASLTKEVSRLQSHCDQLTHQYTVESSNKDLALLRDRNAWSTEREDLNKQLASVRRALTDAKHVESELQEKLTEKEREMANRVRAAREEEWTKARVLDQERRDAEDRLAKAQLVMQDERTRLIFERKEVEKELDLFRKEVQQLQIRIQSVTTQMEKIAQERDDYRQQYNDLQRSEKEFDQMQLEVLNVKKREEAARTALSNVEQSHQSLHKELMQHVEAFEKEKSRLQFELERQQQNAEQAASRFQSQVDEQAGEVQALTAQLEQVVATAKKLKQGYKKRLDENASQLANMTKTLRQRELENQTLRAQLDNENQSANLRIREVHRKQEEFLSFLQHEGVVGETTPKRETVAPTTIPLAL